MKIKVSKDKEDIITTIVINGQESRFDYVCLINGLYNNDRIDNIDFSDDIEEWEREEIRKLIDDINKSVKEFDEDEASGMDGSADNDEEEGFLFT